MVRGVRCGNDRKTVDRIRIRPRQKRRVREIQQRVGFVQRQHTSLRPYIPSDAWLSASINCVPCRAIPAVFGFPPKCDFGSECRRESSIASGKKVPSVGSSGAPTARMPSLPSSSMIYRRKMSTLCQELYGGKHRFDRTFKISTLNSGEDSASGPCESAVRRSHVFDPVLLPLPSSPLSAL
jgi:hypothetical protein